VIVFSAISLRERVIVVDDEVCFVL